MQLAHLDSGAQPVQIVGPRLHHLAAPGQVLGKVVRGTDIVALGVRKLALDRVAVPALLVEQCRGHAAKAVAGHFVFRRAEPGEQPPRPPPVWRGRPAG